MTEKCRLPEYGRCEGHQAYHGEIPGLNTIHARRPFTVEDSTLIGHHGLNKDGVQDSQEEGGHIQGPQRVGDLLLCAPECMENNAWGNV